MRGGAYLLLALVLLPIGMAADIIGIETETGDLEYVRPNAVIDAYVVVETEPNTWRIVLSNPDDRLLSPIGQTTRVFDPNGEGAGCTTCRIPVQLIATEQFVIEMDDRQNGPTGPIVSTEETYTFLIDTTPPTITAHINGCEAVCAHNGAFSLNINVEDTAGVSSVDVQINGVPVTIDCDAVSERQLHCTYEGPANADIVATITAVDGAGNNAVITREAQYDTARPRIDGMRLGNQENDAVALGGQLTTIIVEVTDNSDVWARYESERVGTEESSRCEIINGRYRCEISIPEIPNGNYEEEGTIYVTDAAGNEVNSSYTFTVIETDANTEVDFWTVTASRTDPVNARVARLLPVDLKAKLTFETQSSNARIHSIQGTCGVPTNVWGEREPFLVQVPTTRQLEIPITLFMQVANNYGADGSSPLYTKPIECDLEIRTRRGNTVYQLPERDTVNITVAWVRDTVPPEEAWQAAQEKAERLQQEQLDSIQGLTNTVDTLGLMCGTTRQLADLQHALSLIAGTTYRIPVVGEAAGQIPHQARNGVENVNTGWQRFSNKMCVLVSCQESFTSAMLGVDWMEDLSGSMGFGENGKISSALQPISGTDDLSTLYNPRRSLYAAYSYGCLPAVLHHMERKQVIDCEYTSCVEHIDATDRSLQECKNDKDYMDCRLTTSWAYHALPHANIMQSVKDRLDGAFANPLGVLGLAQSLACQLIGSAQQICQYPEDLRGLGEATRMVNGAQELQLVYQNFQPADICGSVEDKYAALDNPLYKQVYPDADWCTGGLCQKTLDDGSIWVSDGKRVWKATEDQNAGAPDVEGIGSAQALGLAGYNLEEVGQSNKRIEELNEELTTWQNRADQYNREANDQQERVAREEIIALQNELSEEMAQAGFPDADRIRSIMEAANYQRGLYRINTLPGFGTNDVLQTAHTRITESSEEITTVSQQIEELEKQIETQRQELAFREGFDATANQLCEQGIECNDNVAPTVNCFEDPNCDISEKKAIQDSEILLASLEIRKQLAQAEIEEQADIVRAELTQLEYKQYPVSKTVDSMLFFSNIGEAMRVLPQGWATNWMHGSWGWWDDHVGEFLDWTDPEERFIDAVCQEEETANQYTQVLSPSSGSLAMRISAFSQVRENTTAYAVSVYVSVPELETPETFRIKLTGTGAPVFMDNQGDDKFSLSFTQRTGQNALLEMHNRQFTQACIVLDDDLHNYLDTLNTDDDTKEICTTIVRARQ